MKAILSLLITFLLIPVIGFSQFQVQEKVEIEITYGEGVLNKVTSVFIADSETGKFFMGDVKTDLCILYDVEPGDYLLGFEIGDELVIGQHDYIIKIDPVTNELISETSYPNSITVNLNRNLKIHLQVADEQGLDSGIIRNGDYKDKDIDFVFFSYFIPDKNELEKINAQPAILDSVPSSEPDVIPDTGDESLNEATGMESTSRGCTSNMQFANYMKQFYEDYSSLFINPRYAYCHSPSGHYVLNLEEKDIKYLTNCDELKIKKVTINYIKRGEFENSNLNTGEFGKQGNTIIVLKPGSQIKTRDCVKEGKKCNCKFDGIFYVNLLQSVYIRDALSVQQMLCSPFYIPCVVNNVAVKNIGYASIPDHADFFREAILQHERLHCVQFSMLMEALFKGSFEVNLSLPFYFGQVSKEDAILWDKRSKTLADKVCEIVGKVSCCNPKTKNCDMDLCKNRESKILKNAVSKMQDLIKKRFKKFRGKRIVELPAWHFTFIEFNKLKYPGGSCNK